MEREIVLKTGQPAGTPTGFGAVERSRAKQSVDVTMASPLALGLGRWGRRDPIGKPPIPDSA